MSRRPGLRSWLGLEKRESSPEDEEDQEAKRRAMENRARGLI